MDAQYCMPKSKVSRNTILIRLIIPFYLIAFHSPFMRLDVAPVRRFVIESSIITWLGLTGSCIKGPRPRDEVFRLYRGTSP